LINMNRKNFLSIAIVLGSVLAVSAAGAQQFRIEEVASIAAVPVAQLKPKTIAFSDRSGDQQDEGGGIFVRYEDWARSRPLQQEFLGLYPGYTEPNTDIIIDGTKKHYRERLHMYVGEARFLLARASASLKLPNFAALSFAQKIDPAIKHRLVTPAELARPKELKSVHNQNPKRGWCEGREVSICLHSTYKLEGRLPTGIALANKLREGARKISDTLEFESELSHLSAAEVEAAGLRKLTGIETPVIGGLEQNIFYVNQVMQFGKMLAIFQQHPTDSGKTVATVFMVLAIESNILSKRKEFATMPILRNMTPVQVLAGKSSFNSGSSLSAGLPTYARNQIKAIAGLLEAQ
jgi:hypothetical protein